MKTYTVAFLISISILLLSLQYTANPLMYGLPVSDILARPVLAQADSAIDADPLAFSCSNVTEIPSTECEALVSLYNSTSGPSWTNHTNWLITTTPCNWYGIACVQGHVVILELSNNQLAGSISTQLGNLSQLVQIDLNFNQLSGAIPVEVGNLTNLDILYLIGNQLSGNIPSTLGNLTNLTTLALDNNLINGNIPPEIGNLTKLIGFGVSGNQISGAIPSQLGKLTNLNHLTLNNNQMTGSVPTELSSLVNLQSLSLNDNQFSGALSTGFVNLTKLTSFSFNNTGLCEPPDTNFQSWLTSIANLNRTNVMCTTSSDQFREDFSTDPYTNGRWQIYREANNSGAWDNNLGAFYLTRDVRWQSSIMFANYALASRAWNTSFRFKAGGRSNGVCGDQGGDGITFFFYINNFTPAPGRVWAPDRGYSIKLDNYTGRWCDVIPGELVNYIAVMKGYTVLTAVQDDRVEDNQWHTLNISFDNGKIIVSVDNSNVIDYQIENPDYAYSMMGFHAITGNASNDHIIDDFVFTPVTTTTYSISGRVLDNIGNCTQGVTITTNTGKSTLTNIDGTYTIPDLPAGTYTLTASKNNCTFSDSSPTTVPPDAMGINFIEDNVPVANLAIERAIDVTNKTSPYLPNHLTLDTAVKNQSGSVNIPNVKINFYDDDPINGKRIIESISIGDLGPGIELPVSINWQLIGNIENHRIIAEASTSAVIAEPNLSDNITSRPISVYYVDFRHDRDAYSFYNTDVEKIPDSDVVGFLLDFDIPQVYFSPLLPIIGILTEENGYCYGMSNSSIVYFFHPDLRPNPTKTTYEHDYLEARAKIRTYQWNQFGSMMSILLGVAPSDPNEQYRLTLQSIQQGRPVIHGLMNHSNFLPEKGSHAVVAYKIVDLGTEKRVFYYDNNAPLKAPSPQETYGIFNNSGYSEPFYSKRSHPYFYNRAYALQYQLSRPDSIRQNIFDLVRLMLNYQFTNNITSVSSTGAADLIAVDDTGRRVGYLANQEYNEIPGASITTINGLQSLLLPTSNEYQFRLTGTNTSDSSTNATNASAYAGRFSLDIVAPVSKSTARVIQFQEVTIMQGQTAFVEFNPNLIDPRLMLPDGILRSPEINVILNPNTLYLPIVQR